MDERSIELQRRFKEAFLSKYEKEDKSGQGVVLISASTLVKMLEEFDSNLVIELSEVINLMARHKFDFTRKDREFWFLAKERNTSLKNDTASDFY